MEKRINLVDNMDCGNAEDYIGDITPDSGSVDRIKALALKKSGMGAAAARPKRKMRLGTRLLIAAALCVALAASAVAYVAAVSTRRALNIESPPVDDDSASVKKQHKAIAELELLEFTGDSDIEQTIAGRAKDNMLGEFTVVQDGNEVTVPTAFYEVEVSGLGEANELMNTRMGNRYIEISGFGPDTPHPTSLFLDFAGGHPAAIRTQSYVTVNGHVFDMFTIAAVKSPYSGDDAITMTFSTSLFSINDVDVQYFPYDSPVNGIAAEIYAKEEYARTRYQTYIAAHFIYDNVYYELEYSGGDGSAPIDLLGPSGPLETVKMIIDAFE